MKLSDAITAVGRTFRRRPADLLPLYLLGAAVPAITRVVTMAGLAVAYLYLETSGRLAEFRDAAADGELAPPDPEAEPEAFAEWAEGLETLLEPLFPPTVLAVLGVSIAATVLLGLLLNAGVAAGQIAACNARLREKRGLRAGVTGIRRFWRPFLGLYLLEAAILLGTGLVAAAAVAGAAAVSPVLGLVVGAPAFLVWVVVAAVARAAFVFTRPAVVVDEVGTLGALRGSVGYAFAHPIRALVYYLLATVAVFGTFGLAGVLSIVGAGSIVTLLVFVAVSPALDLLKVGLYAGHRESLDPPGPATVPLREAVPAGLRRGPAELRGFVRETPIAHAVAVAMALAGFASGWLLADPYVGLVEASITARIDGWIPPVAALELFGNNATVAFSLAYAGVALAIPAVVGLWFNGLVFGLMARLEADPATLVAFVVPHGVVEIPSIVVAGALGLHLGVVAWRVSRGRAPAARLADALERAFWVLVGIAGLLLVAALIEAFVSPYYWRLFL